MFNSQLNNNLTVSGRLRLYHVYDWITGNSQISAYVIDKNGKTVASISTNAWAGANRTEDIYQNFTIK